MLYKPDRIIIDARIADSYFCKRILEGLADVERVVVADDGRKSEVPEHSSSLTQGKKLLYLKYFQGDPFKLCPGFSDDVLCCNYHVLDLVENCPLECTYCILQAFLNRPVITFHLNVEEMVEKMEAVIRSRPHQPFRVGTGEHSDSLALDHIFQVNAYLVETFSKLPNATLELKTKTDAVDSLMGLEHGGRTVVAWSLNPPEIVKRNELKTASLEERLKSAAGLVDDGYKIAFHFDPIVFYPRWRTGYRRTIEMMFDAVSPENIAWISLGTLRYIPALKQIAERRFPKVSIFCNEFIPGEDGKMRYLKPIRKELLSTIAGWIIQAAPNTPLYLCMEKRSIWKDTLSVKPSDPSALERYLSSKTLSSRSFVS
ncbi:MAG: DNA photolyase [Proteobacteria bacterium]|nr:DNA photolyase [Pseudomonadota bacterium]